MSNFADTFTAVVVSDLGSSFTELSDTRRNEIIDLLQDIAHQTSLLVAAPNDRVKALATRNIAYLQLSLSSKIALTQFDVSNVIRSVAATTLTSAINAAFEAVDEQLEDMKA